MGTSQIVLIATGGTISTVDSGRGAVPKRNARALLAQLGPYRAGVRARVVEFAKIPGCEMTPARMADLAAVVTRELSRADTAGAVVTHGTDTIEESAYFCHLTVASAKPVVFTGSMRTGSDLSWDGPHNLLSAMKVAASPGARGIGAMLAMNEEIHSARFVTKTNGVAVSTFHSPACGPIGRMYNGEPFFMMRPAMERRVMRPRIEENVAMLTATSGDLASPGEVLARKDLRGLVIAGFGGGRVPLRWIPALSDALARGLPIVLASRTGAGVIDDPYGYGGAHHLRSLGMIAAHEIEPHKARLKLMIALGNGLRGTRLKRYVEAD